MHAILDSQIHSLLREGQVIPASPLALTEKRTLDEKHQKALWRYYSDAGAGGIAIGVHTTQFEIREPQFNLFKPILELGKEEQDNLDSQRTSPLIRIAGVCGKTEQAIQEAELVKSLGYHAGLLSLAAFKTETESEIIQHCKRVGEIIPIIGFYLQPAVGGRNFSYKFWREYAELQAVTAIKIAPFNRYKTLDVIRAVSDSGRNDIALYTGNDDSIVLDLITPYRMVQNNTSSILRIAGGLLGHWSVWTQKACSLLAECKSIIAENRMVPIELLQRAGEITDSNAAFFDAANDFSGVIAGVHEVLRRQGLLQGIWCLNPNETLSPGQLDEINRVYEAYPHLNDDAFVEENLERWLRD